MDEHLGLHQVLPRGWRAAGSRAWHGRLESVYAELLQAPLRASGDWSCGVQQGGAAELYASHFGCAVDLHAVV